ncbi:MAG TPA: hypothetical protein VNM48_04300, partial [Chloroflexota bacterium]|nr:hypothetical protein [Chloroflexota bacterium]
EVNDAMLVIGSVAADYQPLTPADDLARCIRYYRRVRSHLRFGAAASSEFYFAMNLGVPMAGTPSTAYVSGPSTRSNVSSLSVSGLDAGSVVWVFSCTSVPSDTFSYDDIYALTYNP